MPNYTQLLYDIEVHSVTGIRRYFDEGGNPNEMYDGKPIFWAMVEMYSRGPRFKDCVQVFIDAGLDFEDQALLAVLADDAEKLKTALTNDPEAVLTKTYSLFNNTYTPLTGGTLLHFCAEYDSVACAKLLLQHGANINAKAAFDEHGLGGHTPIFHTVNQNGNHSARMLQLLLENKADLTHTVKGLIWGKGYEWETFIPAVNPISYAMMGLLPQMHRQQETIAGVVSLLIKHAYGIDYTLPNVPNVYLGH
ncbi:MAG: ankyrin repeat protein [Mucilaginibacter sp.]|nr:ankyrin repeat protein [Mucilaginibacter sp.]